MKRSMITLAAAAASALVLAACGSAQTVEGGATASSTIVVGSQDYWLFAFWGVGGGVGMGSGPAR